MDAVLRGLAHGPIPANVADQSGLSGPAPRPAPRQPNGLGGPRRTCGLGTGDALPRPGGVADLNAARASWRAATIGLAVDEVSGLDVTIVK